MGFGAGAGEVTDPQRPAGPCSLPEPPVAHLGSIHRFSPPCSHPLAVGSVFMEAKVSYLLLFVPGQETKALGRKEETAWLPPAVGRRLTCVLGPNRELTFSHKGSVRDGGWILVGLLF